MISIHFSLWVRKYTSWTNPKIYDINILSSSKCRKTEKRAVGMDRECTNAGGTNPLAPRPAHVTDGNHWRIIRANQLCSVYHQQSPPNSTSLNFSLLTTLKYPPPPSEVSALKGEITPIQSVGVRTISRQVQKNALFIMKVIYTYMPPSRAGLAASLSP